MTLLRHAARRGLAALALVAASALPCVAADTAFPVRTLRFILPYPAGGSADVLARATATQLAAQLGRSVVVDNRPGAGTTLGTLALAQAAPDAHTFMLTTDSTFAINPQANRQLGYDAFKDITPVMVLGTTPNWLVIKATRPEKTLADLVRTIRERPGTVNLSANTLGGVVHLVAEHWKKTAGLDYTVVPYTGIAKVLPDLLGDRLDASWDLVGGTADLVKAGKLRALAVFQDKRSAAVPEVPSYLETPGLKDLDMLSTYVYFVPGGTPPDLVERLYQALARVSRDPELVTRLAQLGIDPVLAPPRESAATVKRLYDRFGVIVRETGFKAN